MKANYKRLKALLALGVRKLELLFLALKLNEFPLFDSCFNFLPLDLDDFRDLANFSPFNFSDFLVYSIPSLPNLSTLPLLLFFSEADLLLLFLLEAD